MSGDLEYALRTLLADVVREQLRLALGDDLPTRLREATSTDAPPPDDGYVSMQRAAEIAQVNPNSIRNWIRRGDLREYRAGRLVRVRLAELHRYLARPPETTTAVNAEQDVRRMLAKARRWDDAKAAALSEATERGENLNHHQLRSRTHAMLRRRSRSD